MFLKCLLSVVSILSLYSITGYSGTPDRVQGNVTKTDMFTAEIKAGCFVTFIDTKTNKNYLPKGVSAPVMAIRVDGKDYKPSAMKWLEHGRKLELSYTEVGIKAVLNVLVKDSHIVLEVASVNDIEKIEYVLWGPYPTTINYMIGECIGVVRDKEYAIGIQTLNAKTIGAEPRQNDIVSYYHEEDNAEYPEIAPYYRKKFKKKQFRTRCALHTEYGSNIQAYCRNRFKDRIIGNWGHGDPWLKKYVAPAYNDGGVIGSKIAIFGCPEDKALETIGKIEVAEGLPHPTIDGKWAKANHKSTMSSLSIEFGEDNIDRTIELISRAGLKQAHSWFMFQTWGEFGLKKKRFPKGMETLKKLQAKAQKKDIDLSFKTLSNFISTEKPNYWGHLSNSSYISPIPDKRLAKIGKSTVAEGVDAKSTTIKIADPTYFSQKTPLNTVMLGDELVQYGKVSTKAPWTLLECKRGSFGTKASAHKSGISIAKLLDCGWNIFFSETDLSLEIARNIANISNETGIKHATLDGLEGNWSTGMGAYGRSLFAEAWYNGHKPELKGKVTTDMSNPGHYLWHIVTYHNWGETCGEYDFRTWHTDYRAEQQFYYIRNLLPQMLGMYRLRAQDSIDDIEWMCAKAAGFDAGFSLICLILDHPQIEICMDAIREWETARMSGAFKPLPREVKWALQEPHNDWHLKAVKEGQWDLFRYYSVKDKKVTQKKSVTIENPYAKQQLKFIIQNTAKSSIKDLTLNSLKVCNGELKKGQILKCFGNKIIRYDQDWNIIDSWSIKPSSLVVEKGKQTISVNWTNSEKEQNITVDFRTKAEAVRINSK